MTNNKGISAFELSILKGNFIDTISIYMKFNNNKLLFHFEILIFIINYINQTNEYTKIVNFIKYFRRDEVKKKIDFNDFNSLNGRTLFHYINIFSPEDNKKLYIYNISIIILIYNIILKKD